MLGLAVLVAAVAVGLAVWNLKPAGPPAPRPVTRFTITLPPGQQLAGLNNGPVVALSPDGTHLAYVASLGGTQQLYLRAMDTQEARPVPGTEGAVEPFFSLDGQWLGFFAGAKLKRISVSGGSALSLVDSSFSLGASWGSQGMLAFAPGPTGLQLVSDLGGAPQPLTRLENGEIGQAWPEFLPGGKAVLFVVGRPGDSQIAVQSVGTGGRQSLIQGGNQPRYALSGHLLYAQRGTLMAVPFDPQRLTVTGATVPVVEGVLQTSTTGGPSTHYSVSTTGSLVYVSGSTQAAQRRLVWVDRKSQEQALLAPAGPYRYPRLSPNDNGQRLAVTVGDSESQISVYDFARDTLTLLTLQGSYNNMVAWTPDGKRIAFESNREGPLNLFSQLADGSGGLARLTTSLYTQLPSSWSPDGLLAFVEINPTTGVDIWVLGQRPRSAAFSLRTFERIRATVFPRRWLARL